MGGTVSISGTINGANYSYNGFANLNNSNPGLITGSYTLLNSTGTLSSYIVGVTYTKTSIGTYTSGASLSGPNLASGSYNITITYTGLPAALPSPINIQQSAPSTGGSGSKPNVVKV